MHLNSVAVRRLLAALLACCGLWVAVAQAAERNASYHAALESIGAEDLARHVGQLASEAMEGREAGTRGGRKAASYLADQWATLHLRGAGVDGGYFQPFPPNLRNVLAMLKGSDPKLKDQVIVVGAHYDHVGRGDPSNSRGPIGYIHPGADDNASGISAILTLAHAFTLLPEPPKRSILFICFDGEEKGLLGSQYFVAHPTVSLDHVVVMLNVDMIGRLRNDRLGIYGSRSGYGLRRLLCEQNTGFTLVLQFPWGLTDDADHYPFFARGVPAIMFHTGLHDEYHTPRDKAKTIDSAGMNRVVRLLFAVVYDLADRPDVPRLRKAAGRETEDARKAALLEGTTLVNRLGVGWQPGAAAADGVRLTRVMAGSAAERAKLRAGDRIVEFAGRVIRGADDLLEAVRSAESPASVVVHRPDHKDPLELSVRLAGKPLPFGVRWRADDAEPGTVTVTHVAAGSVAAKAGLRPGDRIYQVGGRDFANETELAQLVKSRGDPLELQTERDGRIRVATLPSDADDHVRNRTFFGLFGK